MLVLGAVQIFGPANGYQLRRELLSWEVERWAYLNPGSIYSMLTTLEKQGAITGDRAVPGKRREGLRRLPIGSLPFGYHTTQVVPISGTIPSSKSLLNP